MITSKDKNHIRAKVENLLNLLESFIKNCLFKIFYKYYIWNFISTAEAKKDIDPNNVIPDFMFIALRKNKQYA